MKENCPSIHCRCRKVTREDRVSYYSYLPITPQGWIDVGQSCFVWMQSKKSESRLHIRASLDALNLSLQPSAQQRYTGGLFLKSFLQLPQFCVFFMRLHPRVERWSGFATGSSSCQWLLSTSSALEQPKSGDIRTIFNAECH